MFPQPRQAFTIVSLPEITLLSVGQLPNVLYPLIRIHGILAAAPVHHEGDIGRVPGISASETGQDVTAQQAVLPIREKADMYQNQVFVPTTKAEALQPVDL